MKILYTTDGHPPARAAEQLLARLVRRHETSVCVLCVSSFDLALEDAAAAGRYSPDATREHASRITEETAGRLRTAGFSVTTITREGEPTVEILREAADRKVDLIVLGGGKESWLGAVVMGSTSTAVLHEAPTAVLIVHVAREGEGPLRVLVATDGSPGALAVARRFAGVADPDRVTVTVVSVVERLGSPHGGTSESEAAQRTEEVLAELRQQGFDAEATVLTGISPAKSLLEQAKDVDADLIVVGAHGHGRARRRLRLGSVTDKVVRHARATLVGHE